MKLRKLNNGYYSLYDSDGDIVASNNPDTPCSKKLSKENCDGIFGVINVEKLADEYIVIKPKHREHEHNLAVSAYIEGFNKAMEFNKDKLFTVEDVKKGIYMSNHVKYAAFSIDEIIQSLQQPTEIDVEIETIQYGLGNDEDGRPVFETRNLLDENGCLILKKK